jgi:hypothetical protein
VGVYTYYLTGECLSAAHAQTPRHLEERVLLSVIPFDYVEIKIIIYKHFKILINITYYTLDMAI